ncbi:MAG: TraR/DksA C4-type zinc finger protein [Magnetovibrionaceae bacterium]
MRKGLRRLGAGPKGPLKARSNGFCGDCGEPIEADRLAIEPGAARCVYCQDQAEKKGCVGS